MKLTFTGEKFAVSGEGINSNYFFQAAQEMTPLVGKTAFKGEFRERRIFVREKRERFFDANFSDVFAECAGEIPGKITRRMKRMDV